jgi:micrococcal nuclease
MTYRVTHIVDGDTFEVTPKWEWGGTDGNRVRPIGYDTPERFEENYKEATKKLRDLILGKEVELKGPIKLSYDRLLCKVYFEGRDLTYYFPEYER